MKSYMVKLHVPRGPSQVCGRDRRDKSKKHMRHAKPKAIGSWGICMRTRHLSNPLAESLPGTRGHAHHAPASGETTDFATRFDFFRWSKSQIPVSRVRYTQKRPLVVGLPARCPARSCLQLGLMQRAGTGRSWAQLGSALHVRACACFWRPMGAAAG
jgi:hypothetical protein